jgi:hypothetical protein
MSQAIMIVRMYEPAMQSPKGPLAARVMFEPFAGFIPLPVPVAASATISDTSTADASNREAAIRREALSEAETLESLLLETAGTSRSGDAVAEGTAHLDRALALALSSAKARAEFMLAMSGWMFIVTGPRIRHPEKLPTIARVAYGLYVLWSELFCEGLEFWLAESWQGRYIDLVEAGCRRVGAVETLACLAALRALFPEYQRRKRRCAPLSMGWSHGM